MGLMMGLSVALNEADVTLNEVGRLELWRRGYDCLHDVSSLMRSGIVQWSQQAVQHRPRGIGLAWSGLAWLETRTPSQLGRW